MRKIVFFILTIFLIIFSCQTYSTGNCNTNNNTKTNQSNNVIKIIALVEIQIVRNQKDYILIEKPESKSRISYHLINLKNNQKEELKKLKGKLVEANIKVIQELSPWNKKAELLSIKLKK